jgi:hypothetical protein
MTGYSTEGWHELFILAGGATAALSGLIFVGLSVNIKEVLALEEKDGAPLLTGRGLEALVALLNVLVICIVGAVPNINRGVLAAFILVVARKAPSRRLGLRWLRGGVATSASPQRSSVCPSPSP